jgi:peptide/nickel transport system permease protein
LLLLSLVALAVFAPLLPLPEPTRPDLLARLAAPTLKFNTLGAHPFGTDQLGRDLLSRIAYGARITLLVATIAVGLGACVGSAFGLLAGFFGGIWDRVIMRIADMQLAVPMILLALLIVSLAGPSLRNLILVLALTSWVRYARVVRAQVLSLRSRDFITAARAIDASALRIILMHILPNVVGAIVVVGTLELARAILLESSLSFLGMGVQPPTPSWGRMLAEGRTFISSHWWIATFPGLAIALTVLSINLIGDQLRDYSDPTLRKAFK